MYERMLDKSLCPDVNDMTVWCGDTGKLFLNIIDFAANEIGAEQEIRFPYGNSYGWCVTFRKKKKLFCDIFAEKNAFNVMLRLSNDAFEQVYPTLTAYTQGFIDNKYPCGNGGWIHYRVTSPEHLVDIEKLLMLK